MLGAGQHTGVPSIASACSLSDVLALGETDREKILTVVIDVDNYGSFIDQNLNDLRALRKEAIPMLAFVSNYGAEAANPLRDEGFLMWRWDKRSLEGLEIPQTEQGDIATRAHGFFQNLNQRCLCCARGSVQLYPVKDARIDAICASLSTAEELIENGIADDCTEDIYKELWWAFARLLRTSVPFNEMASTSLQDDIRGWRAALSRRRGFVSPELLDTLEQAIELIEGLLGSQRNEKERAVYRTLLYNTPDGRATIVVRSEWEAREASLHWVQHAPGFRASNLTVLPYGAVKAAKSPVTGRLIVVGWLGRDRMASLLAGSAAETVQLVLYEGCETGWYVNQSRARKRAAIKTDDSARVLAMPGVACDGSLPALPEPPGGSGEDRDSMIDKVEEQHKQLAYARLEAKGDDIARSVEAIPVHYAGDLLSFYRENGTLTDVSGVIAGEGGLPKERRVGDAEGLCAGSFILLKDADREPIVQLADKILGDAADDLRETAGEWKEDVEKIKEESWGFDWVAYERLLEHGMKKSFEAVARLLNDSDMISPGRSEREISDSVRAIARTARDRDLEARAEEVARAGIKVQTAHRRAGKRLADALAKSFPEYVAEHDLAKPEDIWAPVEFEIEDIGTVKLCRIVEIDRGRRVLVPKGQIGELFEE